MKATQRKKGLIYAGVMMVYAYMSFFLPTFAVSGQLQKAIAKFWDTYWFYCALFVSLGVLTGLLAFIVLFIRLGYHSTNSQERSRIMKEMIAVAISTAALGSITFIVTLYLSFFNN